MAVLVLSYDLFCNKCALLVCWEDRNPAIHNQPHKQSVTDETKTSYAKITIYQVRRYDDTIHKNNHLIVFSQCQYNWTNQIILIQVQSLHSDSVKSVCGGSVQPPSRSLLLNLRSFYKSKDRSQFNHFGDLRTKMVETRQIFVPPRRRTEVRTSLLT